MTILVEQHESSPSFQRYAPCPIVLPATGTLWRQFYDHRSHRTGKPRLTEADYAGYDKHTVFYDVFLDAHSSCIRAVGPPLVNFKRLILPIRMQVAGISKSLRHRMSPHGRVTFHRFDLPRDLSHVEQVSYRCQLGNILEKEGIAYRVALAPVNLQFTTLQKNNPVEWVLDWLRYYTRLGVERMLLYDNGSDNADELANALMNCSDIMDVVLIDWPFPYGPVRSNYNLFCQASQNNHAHQCFGQAEWTGHFDVDEYLAFRDGLSLTKMLSQVSKRTGLLRFDSFWVPNVHSDSSQLELQTMDVASAEKIPTVRNFCYRERNSRGKAHKYIACQRLLRVSNTHNAKLKLGYRRRAVPTDDAAFLHYKALTNNWKGAGRADAEPMDTLKHVKDMYVINVLENEI